MKAPIGRELSPVSCGLLLRLFPFGVVVNPEMRIEGAGEKLLQVWGGNTSILNRHICEVFKLRRPKGISFTWRNVSYSKNLFFFKISFDRNFFIKNDIYICEGYKITR